MLNGKKRYAISCFLCHSRSDVFEKTDGEAKDAVLKKGWHLFWTRQGEMFFPVLVCKKCTQKIMKEEAKNANV